MTSIEARVAFTETLKEHGIKEGHEYAILTNEMYESWSGLSASQYRDFNGISNKDSLRDHMSLLEVASTIFSEATASEILSKTEAKSFFETRQAIHIAGKITKEAIEKIEKQLVKKSSLTIITKTLIHQKFRKS